MAAKIMLAGVLLGLLAVMAMAAEGSKQQGYHGEEEKYEHYKPAKKGYYHGEEEERYEHYKPAKKGYYHGEEEKPEHYKPAKKGYYHEEEEKHKPAKKDYYEDEDKAAKKATKYEFELLMEGEVLYPPLPEFPAQGETLIRINGLYWGSVSPMNKVAGGYVSALILNLTADQQSIANAVWNIEFTGGKFKGSELAAQGKIVWDTTGNVHDEFLITGGSGQLLGATGTFVTTGTGFRPTVMAFKLIVPNREHHYAVGRFGDEY